MFTIYPASERFHFDYEWLRGSRNFSFDEYQDSANQGFGPLRAFNDNTIAPSGGFDTNSQSEVEVVSILLRGQLHYEDNLGNVAVSSFGGIQRISAGTGIVQREHNASEQVNCSLLELWFEPEVQGLIPSYATTSFNPASLSGQLLPVVSRQGGDKQVTIHQDLTIYLSRLETGERLEFVQQPHRRTYLFVINGALRVNEQYVLNTRDSARAQEVDRFEFIAEQPVFWMLIDLP